ncbi:hypothetical protein FRC08_005459 [Ceratobasidium sp. 394]|nr:hypothetical protein FRC08_005459 [Ceratobasidium sp. 394]KAG9076028.1 hypothetical protein FS749_012240 [Ceratobasidium sp. UAMH 11750]
MSPPSSSNQPARNRPQPALGASSKYSSAQPRPTPSPKASPASRSTNSLPSGPSDSQPKQNDILAGSESEPTHPFAQSSGLVQIIRPTVKDLIEEEANFWDEFTTDDGNRSGANTSGRVSPPGSAANRSVFSNDIWLDDNCGNADRTFARDVQLVGWANVGDNISTGYVVYDCAIRTKEGITIHLHKRYSSFVKLNDALRRTLPPDVIHNIPALPSKNALAKYRPAFLDSRRRKLQTWLAAVLMHPDIGGCQAVRQWVLE